MMSHGSARLTPTGQGTTVRTAVLTIVGAVLVAVGLALLVLPGPGLLLIAAGLAVLAQRFDWAQDLLDRTRERLPHRRTRRKATDTDVDRTEDRDDGRLGRAA